MTKSKIKEEWRLAKGGGYPINYVKNNVEVIFVPFGNGRCFVSIMGATSFDDFVSAILGTYKKRFKKVWPWISEQLVKHKITHVLCRAYSQGGRLSSCLYKNLIMSGMNCDFLFFGAPKGNKVDVTNITYDNDIVSKWPFWKNKTYKNYYLTNNLKWWEFKKIHEYYREEFE